MNRRSLASLAAGVVMATTLSGCAETPSQDELTVVASFYPLQFVTERIMGRGEVSTLTLPGVEPHDVDLTPKQVVSLASADLVVYQGGGFQPAVEAAIAEAQPNETLDVWKLIDPLPLSDDADGDAAHEHAQDQGHDSPGALDPHAWLDPKNMARYAAGVAEALERVDPDNAERYRTNLAALEKDFARIDESFSAGLRDCARDEFVTTHAAFGYLAERYQLRAVGISGVSPDAEPSPAKIAEIHHLVESTGVTTIFFESLASPTVAESIARDLDLRTDVLDPIEGLTPKSRGKDYLAVMESNLAALEKANGCG